MACSTATISRQSRRPWTSPRYRACSHPTSTRLPIFSSKFGTSGVRLICSEVPVRLFRRPDWIVPSGKRRTVTRSDSSDILPDYS
jgi:hypothetical protein